MTNLIYLLSASLCAFSADFVSEPHRPPAKFEEIRKVFPEAYDANPKDPIVELEVLKEFRMRQRSGSKEIAFRAGDKITAYLTGQNSYGTIALVVDDTATSFEFGRAKFSFDKVTDVAAYSDPKTSNQYYGRFPFAKTRLGIRVSRNSALVAVSGPEETFIEHERGSYTYLSSECSRDSQWMPYKLVYYSIGSLYDRTFENWNNSYQVEIFDENKQVLARGSGKTASVNAFYVLKRGCKYSAEESYCTNHDNPGPSGCVAP